LTSPGIAQHLPLTAATSANRIDRKLPAMLPNDHVFATHRFVNQSCRIILIVTAVHDKRYELSAYGRVGQRAWVRCCRAVL